MYSNYWNTLLRNLKLSPYINFYTKRILFSILIFQLFNSDSLRRPSWLYPTPGNGLHSNGNQNFISSSHVTQERHQQREINRRTLTSIRWNMMRLCCSKSWKRERHLVWIQLKLVRVICTPIVYIQTLWFKEVTQWYSQRTTVINEIKECVWVTSPRGTVNQELKLSSNPLIPSWFGW